LHLEGHTIS